MAKRSKKTKPRFTKPQIRIIATILIILCASLGTWAVYRNLNQELPHKKEIQAFLASLKYSSLDGLMRPDASITLDFKENIWTINNVFAYDEDGTIVNEKFNSGVCTELSQLTYDFVKPLFSDKYNVYFLVANESRFFSRGDNLGATHFLIRLTPKKGLFRIQKSLGIDATYKIYDYLRNYKGYKFSKRFPTLKMFDNKDKGIQLGLNTQYPLTFSKDGKYLLSLVVKNVKDNFDKDHFALMVYATREHEMTGKAVLAFIKNDGNNELFKHDIMLAALLEQEELNKLASVLAKLFTTISY